MTKTVYELYVSLELLVVVVIAVVAGFDLSIDSVTKIGEQFLDHTEGLARRIRSSLQSQHCSRKMDCRRFTCWVYMLVCNIDVNNDILLA